MHAYASLLQAPCYREMNISGHLMSACHAISTRCVVFSIPPLQLYIYRAPTKNKKLFDDIFHYEAIFCHFTPTLILLRRLKVSNRILSLEDARQKSTSVINSKGVPEAIFRRQNGTRNDYTLPAHFECPCIDYILKLYSHTASNAK